MKRPRRQIAMFAALSLASVGVAAGYVANAAQRGDRTQSGSIDSDPALVAASVARVTAEPHVVFRNLAGKGAGHLAVAPLADPDGDRVVTGQACLRVYAKAGSGLCLSDKGDLFTPYDIRFLGPDYTRRHTESLSGLVSRARISADGRHGAATVFVTGHSYANGSFSTETTLHDMANGELLGGLDGFEVRKDGEEIKAVDFNFWGVTFTADPDVFYATLGTGDHTYLVKGDLETYTMDVVRDGVECPSLSPDGTRIAFKHKVKGGESPVWRPAVLDVATMEQRLLPETRNVDDQIEWLDDQTVLYAVDTGKGAPDVWATAADGAGTARLFLTDADSPAVVR